MRKLITTSLFFILVSTLFAQSPEKMSYQAVIRNGSNKLITNSPVGMRISILQSSITGTSVYTETQKPTTNINGLISIEIGSGTVISGNFASIDWSKGPYFIKTETDPAGGTNYSIVGTSQLLSVPYALYAKTAGNGFSGNYNDLNNKPNIPTNVSQLNNDKGYLTKFIEKDSSIINEIQSLSIRNDTLFLSKGGGAVSFPRSASIGNGSGSFYFVTQANFSTSYDSFTCKYGSLYPDYAKRNFQEYSFIIPESGTIRNLIVTPNTSAVASGSLVKVNILLNGKPTALGLDVTNADGFNYKINDKNGIAVKRGDYIAIAFKSGSVKPGTNFQTILELATNTNKNEFTHYIGELFGGGIVVSVWKDTSGEHGLIASLKDLSSGVEWSNLSTDTIGISARSPIDGASNTNAIINQVGHTSSAAQLCNSYSMGGFKDWYLPSIIELKTCESAFYIVNMILGSNDGFKHGSYYWSSTESNLGSSSVYYGNVVHFGVPGGYSSPKNFNCRVRAVRRF